MALKSKTVLAFTDGQTIPNTNTVTWIGNAAATTSLAGTYSSIPSLCLSGANTVEIAKPIECNGFRSAHIMPCGVQNNAITLYVYGVWGNAQDGGTHSRYAVHLLATIACAASTGTVSMTSPLGTAYVSSGALTLTAGTTAVLDLNAIGATATAKQDGSASAIAMLGIADLAGCDYLAFATNAATSAADYQFNAYVRLID